MFRMYKMNFLISAVLLAISYFVCEAGVTDIPLTPSDEAVVEIAFDDAWMPSNIFDVKTSTSSIQKEKELENDIVTVEETSNQIFRAIRNFIFHAGDSLIETEQNDDPTEEIVKIIEKGIIEATTMFLTPSDDAQLVPTSEEPTSESISVSKIENEASDSVMDKVGVNILNFSNSNKRQSLSIVNTTTACSTCYNTLETCVLQCFSKHNCNDVQRKARVCPPTSARLCNIFTQWGPVDECKIHEDCKSPLLCCSDGCINKCSSGVWQN